MFAAVAPVLLFVAFLLLLLVSLSTPIIKSIFLFNLTADFGSGILNTGASGSANFGVWGYCISSIDFSIAVIKHSTAPRCSPVQLGYTFDKSLATALHTDNVQNVISRTTTAALVLHPIAAGLTFLAVLMSFFTFRRGSNDTSRLPSLLTLGVGLLAAILTTFVFLTDVILVVVVKHKIRDASKSGLEFNWGNMVWMTLGATIALWLSLVKAFGGVCACGRHRREEEKY